MNSSYHRRVAHTAQLHGGSLEGHRGACARAAGHRRGPVESQRRRPAAGPRGPLPGDEESHGRGDRSAHPSAAPGRHTPLTKMKVHGQLVFIVADMFHSHA
ncbi:uncharacterized protein LOC133467942 isoform X2 [Phyllopteryx taeniolatus]|uniref:uncharacterized protein LOC133467942 isoform X2 n=1 Tax=Phyllopteryx taeniolatus TaxID=161469 RepID=UPI002AD1F441|nr:uncharacterized protein LOC133467942 isoform X2 [Phyllopteryx taeniolatus]